MLDSIEFKSLSKHVCIMGIFFILLVLSLYWLRETIKIKEGLYTKPDLEFAEAQHGKGINDDVRDRDICSSLWDNPHENEENMSSSTIRAYLNAMEEQFNKNMRTTHHEIDKLSELIEVPSLF